MVSLGLAPGPGAAVVRTGPAPWTAASTPCSEQARGLPQGVAGGETRSKG